MQENNSRRISVTFKQDIGTPDDFAWHSYSKIIIHTPHAGRLLPMGSAGHPILTYFARKAIQHRHAILCDHYTDKLFSPIVIPIFGYHYNRPEGIIQQISFPYSRVFCDVERLENDPLEEKGLGIYGKWTLGGRSLWTKTKEEAMEMYHDHQEALSQAIYSGCILLDCHSFSERDNVLCPNAHKYKDVDICLGFNDDDTMPDEETLITISIFFRKFGYRVEYNKPFSNSKTVETNQPYHSLMIEVNKHCYMNEDTLEITAGYYKLHAELQELYKLLLNH